MIEAGAIIGSSPRETMVLTLPELMLALRGWQRRKGIDPDKSANTRPMTRARLMELIEKDNLV